MRCKSLEPLGHTGTVGWALTLQSRRTAANLRCSLHLRQEGLGPATAPPDPPAPCGHGKSARSRSYCAGATLFSRTVRRYGIPVLPFMFTTPTYNRQPTTNDNSRHLRILSFPKRTLLAHQTLGETTVTGFSVFDQQVPCVRGYFLAKAESGGKGGKHQAPRQYWRSRPRTVTRLEVPSKSASRRQEVMCDALTTRCTRLAAACPMFRTHTPPPFRPTNTAGNPGRRGGMDA